jgi:aminoglycoside phosphotransferase (APT) family kinase protein
MRRRRGSVRLATAAVVAGRDRFVDAAPVDVATDVVDVVEIVPGRGGTEARDTVSSVLAGAVVPERLRCLRAWAGEPSLPMPRTTNTTSRTADRVRRDTEQPYRPDGPGGTGRSGSDGGRCAGPQSRDMSLTVTQLADRLGVILRLRVEGMRRLSGGASRETWAFDGIDRGGAGRRELILRRDPPGSLKPGDMELEARLLRSAARAGVPVPALRAAGPPDPERLETSYLVMDRVAGETIARKILRDPQYAGAHAPLAHQLATALARLHAVDPAEVVGLQELDPLAKIRATHDEIGQPSPAFELAFRWLERNRPAPSRKVLVHGDFRMGNIIVNEQGLAAVLDWELAHIGDPLEDLAWVRVRAWRFGGPGEVAGVGEREEFFQAYEAASGTQVDREAAHWWLIFGTLQWGVMCESQLFSHLSGATRSVELAAIGRRVSEQEYDLMELLP